MQSSSLPRALALSLAVFLGCALVHSPAALAATPAYVSGGVGTDERDALKQAGAGYPLELLFAENGLYLADIAVAIEDSGGKVALLTRAEGPLMFVDLPAGRYRISAESGGTRLTRTVDVKSGRHALVVFNWERGPQGDLAAQ